MADPAAGINRATSFGDREPPASRSKKKGKARAKGATRATDTEIALLIDAANPDEDEKHELDTMA
jgi:hypothetical protein